MAFPTIQSAIPKRRYKFGEFIITILSDIETQNAESYLYVAAVLRDGSTQPEVYITCEPSTSENKNSYLVKVLSKDGEHIISEDKQWKQEQKFCEYALEGIQQMFELTDEIPALLS